MKHRSRQLATLSSALAVVLALILTSAACGSSAATRAADDATTTTTNPTGAADHSYGFTLTSLTLVDPSRPTEAGTQTPQHAGRTLVTDVYVPEGPGPFPLVVFAHGLGGAPGKVSGLLSAWVKAGYVVAAPTFPVTNSSVPGMAGNWMNVAAQPGDVSFVLDTLLGTGGDAAALTALNERLGTDSGPSLPARVDPNRIGVAGHSLGAATVYGVTFNTCCRDPRIKAAEALSGAELPVGVPPGGEFQLDGHVPLLIIHGEKDGAFDFKLPTGIYTSAQPPVWFVTLIGGSHAPPYEDTPSPWDDAVMAITTGFWDATIGQVDGAMARFEAAAVVPGLTTLQHK